MSVVGLAFAVGAVVVVVVVAAVVVVVVFVLFLPLHESRGDTGCGQILSHTRSTPHPRKLFSV